MPQPDKEIDDTFDTGGEELYLSVIIGDGQDGRSRVYLDKTRIYQDSNIWKFRVGADLGGKELMVRTVIADVNRHTNNVSATYVLEAANTEEWELHDEVDEEGEDAYFRARFALT